MSTQIPDHSDHEQASTSDETVDMTAPSDRIAQVEPNSVAAQALLELWQGTPAIIIDSPPGAGKSATITVVAANLAGRGRFRVGISTNTSAQVTEIANRLYDESPGVTVVVLDSKNNSISRAQLRPGIMYVNALDPEVLGNAFVLIANSAKWAFVEPDTVDMMLVDESRQMTWASLQRIAPATRQVMLVGDPGQIPPIITGDRSQWEGRFDDPGLAAPEALMKMRPAETVVLNLSSTRRLGPLSAAVIAPLYPFPFISERGDVRVVSPANKDLSELRVQFLDPADAVTATDQTMLSAVASRAAALTRCIVHDHFRGVIPCDVLVAVAHRTQVAGITAELSRLDLGAGSVRVDTFDSLQGLEASAVVTLDPLAGQPTLTEHGMEPGRLCVALSRHRGHLTFVTISDVLDQITVAGMAGRIARQNREVRKALFAATGNDSAGS